PVENGVPAGVLVRPGGFEEPLSSAEMLVAFFSSRNVSYAMASIDNSRSQILLATYSRLDKAAFAWLAAANATDNATSQSGDFAFSQNKSEAFGYFSGIANLSAPAAYAYEYSVGAGNAGLGRHNLTISITDMFGENDTYTTVFFRKDGTTLSMKCASGSAEVSIKDSEGTPLQGAAISISPCGGASCTSDLEGRCRVACGAGIGAMSAVFNGTDKHFGSYASCSSGAGIGQDFAFGIAAACVALAFAAWLIRKKK
ncbi:MAG TPA: hypothetical protein PLO51_02180, partial [Candidatus Micrarchaeota archaeon]|nr:hypothetical protein [Candidatus Micrarchaeota archaeon]